MAAARQEPVKLVSKGGLNIEIYSNFMNFNRAHGIIVFDGKMSRGHASLHTRVLRIVGGEKVLTTSFNLLEQPDIRRIIDEINTVITTQNTLDKATDFEKFIDLFSPYINMEMVKDEEQRNNILDILTHIIIPDILETINNYLSSQPKQTGGFSNLNKTKSKKLGKRIRKSNKHRKSLSRKTKSRKH